MGRTETRIWTTGYPAQSERGSIATAHQSRLFRDRRFCGPRHRPASTNRSALAQSSQSGWRYQSAHHRGDTEVGGEWWRSGRFRPRMGLGDDPRGKRVDARSERQPVACPDGSRLFERHARQNKPTGLRHYRHRYTRHTCSDTGTDRLEGAGGGWRKKTHPDTGGTESR